MKVQRKRRRFSVNDVGSAFAGSNLARVNFCFFETRKPSEADAYAEHFSAHTYTAEHLSDAEFDAEHGGVARFCFERILMGQKCILSF